MSAVVNATAKARRETCTCMTGGTCSRNVDPLEVELEVRGQSGDFAADSSGVGEGDGVLSDPIARVDDLTAMHGDLARHTPAVVGPDSKKQSHACYGVHTRQKQA